MYSFSMQEECKDLPSRTCATHVLCCFLT